MSNGLFEEQIIHADETIKLYSPNLHSAGGMGFVFRHVPTPTNGLLTSDWGLGFGTMGKQQDQAERFEAMADSWYGSFRRLGHQPDSTLPIFATHPHLDHTQGLKMLAKHIRTEVSATPLCAYLVDQIPFGSHYRSNMSYNILHDQVGSFQRGPFHITYGPVVHSIPQARFAVITVPTPTGRPYKILMLAECRIEEGKFIARSSPSPGQTMIKMIRELGPYDLVLIDGLRRGQKGRARSADVNDELLRRILAKIPGDLYIPYLSSKIEVTHGAVLAAEAAGFGFGSRGAGQNRFVSIAREQGWIRAIIKSLNGRYVWAVTGSQAEPGSWLEQVAHNPKRRLEVPPNAYFFLAQGPIPMYRDEIRAMLTILAEEVVPEGGIILASGSQRRLKLYGRNIYTVEQFTGVEGFQETSGHGARDDQDELVEHASAKGKPGRVIFYQYEKNAPEEAPAETGTVEYTESFSEEPIDSIHQVQPADLVRLADQYLSF